MTWKVARFDLKSSRRLLQCIVALLVAARVHHCLAQENRSEKFEVFAEFNFKPSDCGLFLPVKFKGREYLFLLDTGTSLIAFDEALRPSLGAPIGHDFLQDSGGHRLRTDLFSAPPAKLGRISLRTREPVVCLDLGSYRHISGIEVRGILGVSLIRQHVVYLDADNNKVVFLDRPGHSLPSDTISSTNQSFFQITASLSHVENTFILDSGTKAFGGLDPKKFDELVRATEMTITGTDVVATLVAPEFVTVGQLEKFEFAGQRFDHPVFLRSAPNRLGWTFMTNFNWIMDYPHKTAGTIPRKSGAK